MKINIKYILGVVLLGVLSPMYIYAQSDIYAGCTGQFFKLTAYYSPMTGQEYYVHDSYQDDINLNGRGTHGASGKPVFDGMIAAPRKYAFGTKIIFPGLGTGEVSDRGGAIVAGSGGDRIDLRAGRGVLGIRRAYGMGPVGITGYICSGDIYNGNLGFTRPAYDDSYDDVVFWTLNQSPGRQDLMVAKLQYILNKYNYLTGEYIYGKYDDFTKIGVCNYQIKKNIYTGYNDDCGTWGPKTRVLFKTDLFGTNIKMDVKNVQIIDSGNKNLENTNSLTLQKGEQASKETDKDSNKIKTVPKLDLSNSKTNSKTGKSDTKTTKSENTANLPAGRQGIKNNKDKNVKVTVDKPKILTKLPMKYKTYFATTIDEGDKSVKVKILQNILSNEGIQVKKTGIMDEQTKSAVYGLQLKYKLITPSDKSELKGYMGPGTRELLNKLYSIKN